MLGAISEIEKKKIQIVLYNIIKLLNIIFKLIYQLYFYVICIYK